jgi:ABC-type nitrate/sulfonate/bicarbonate transport system substrate-binding protein
MKKFGEPKSTLQAIVVRPDVAYKYKTIENLAGSNIGVPYGSIGHKQAITIEKDGWETDEVPSIIARAKAGNSIFYPSENKTIGELIQYSGKKKGVKYGSVLDLGTEIQMAQLRARTIEVVCTWEPYVLWMEKMKIGKRFVSSPDTLCQCRTGTHFHVSSPILARTDFIQARPDIVEAFLQAEEDAKESITKDPDGSANAISKEIPEVPIDIIQKDLRMMVYDGRIHPEMMEHHRRSAKLSQDLGIYRGERTGWTPEKTVDYGYDPSYLNNVIEKRKKEGKWTSENLGILRNW